MPSFRERVNSLFAPPTKNTDPLGRSGTVNTRGFIGESEQNAVLFWPYNLEIYDRMRRTDPTIRWMLSLISTPIQAATWTVEPFSEDEKDLEVAAFIEWCLFDRLSGGWDEWLRQVLTYLVFGHSVFERVADFEPVSFAYSTTDNERKIIEREAFVLDKLAPRLQRTIFKWVPSEDDISKLDHIEQFLADGRSPSNPKIPANKLVIFTNEKEGDDYRGISILRTAYKSYQYKHKLENLEAIAYERSAGLPIVYPPDNATADELDAVEEAVKDMRQGESLYLVMPGPKAGSVAEKDGWLIEDLAITGDAGGSPNLAIQRYEEAMAKNVLAEFMRLGHQNMGARATADVQQDPYYQAIEAQVNHIEDVINDEVIKPLVSWNYEVEGFPRICASKIQAKNVEVVGNLLTNMINAGVVHRTFETEQWVRELIDAPLLPPGFEWEDPKEDQTDPVTPETPEDPTETSPSNEPRDPADENPTLSLWDEDWTPSRTPTGPEKFVAFGDIMAFLNTMESEIVATSEQVLEPQVSAFEDAVGVAVENNQPELITTLSVTSKDLATALENKLNTVYEEGWTQVKAELRRQGATFADAPEKTTKLPEIIAARAVTAADSIASQATRAARNYGLKRLESPQADPDASAPGADPRAATRAAAGAAARGLVSSVFNLGRKDAMIALMSDGRNNG